MTTGYFESKDNDSYANLLLSENKRLADRANIFSLAETIFLSAFVGLVTADNGLPGLFAWFPIIMCSAGIAFSAYWILQSKNQKMSIIALNSKILPLVSTEKGTESSTKFYSEFVQKSLRSTIAKYEWLPIGFVIVWSLLLSVYSLYVINAIHV